MILLNDTTFKADNTPPDVEVVVGDEKQADYYPRLKLKRWENECNLSVGLVDDTLPSDFFPVQPRQPLASDSLRWFNLGAIEPVFIPILYELPHHTNPGLTITTYYGNQPYLMLFEQYPYTKYLDHQPDIPMVRAASRQGNPYYGDQGLPMIDLYFGVDPKDYAEQLMQAVITVLATELGVKVYPKPDERHKLYYRDPAGNDVKIFSAEIANGHLWTYLNINTDYLKAYDYYAKTIAKDIHDPVAYGLQANYPQATTELITPIIKQFVELTGLSLDKPEYTAAELTKMNELEPIHRSDAWVLDGVRTDVGWWYDEGTNGFEFETTLETKPASNVVSLSTTFKDIIAYVQGPLTPEQRAAGEYRAPNVENSLAVYHATYDPLRGDTTHELGKLTHLYRPYATDATGQQVWCDFENIADYADGEVYDLSQLNIVIPQAFLDTATYPVVLDPILGYTNAGASQLNPADDLIKGTVYNSGRTSILNSVYMYLGTNTAATVEYEGAVYNLGDSTLVAQSTNGTAITAAPTWQKLDFAGESVAIGNDYVLCFWGQGTGGSYSLITANYDSTSGKTSKTQSLVYSSNNWPSPATFADEANRQYSLYITYGTTAIRPPSLKPRPFAPGLAR